MDTSMMLTNTMQFAMAAMGSLGFAILFNTKGYKLCMIGIGGALAWIAYLVTHACTDNVISSLLMATIIVAALAEIMARIVKTPVISLLVPMLIPLIPGRDLYFTMQNVVFGRMEEAFQEFQLVLTESGAIAVGIILLTFLSQFILKLSHYLKQVKK